MSWIYAIAVSPTVVKIGCTTTSTLGRLRQAQTWHAEPLQVLARLRLRGDPKPIESLIHRGLVRYQVPWPHRGVPRPTELFTREPEVQSFIEILRQVKSTEQLEVYLARLFREVRCDLCKLPIPLDTPIADTRCASCAEKARADGERLRAAKVATRQRREAQRDERLPAKPEGAGYMSIEAAARYLGGGTGLKFLRVEAYEGRLQSARFKGSVALWFRPEWIDAWVMLSASPPLPAAVDPHGDSNTGTPPTRV